MEITTMQRLSFHLSSLLPVLIEQEPSVLCQPECCRIYEPQNPRIEPQVLNLLTDETIAPEVLQQSGNFLVLTADPTSVHPHIGPKTNVILIPGQTDPAEVLAQTDGFFTAAQMFRQFSPMLLSALENQNSLENYLNLFSAFTRHPVAILDDGLSLFAHAALLPRSPNPEWVPRIPAMETEPGGEVRAAFLNRLSRLTYPVFVEQPGISRRIVVSLRGAHSGFYLLEVLEGETPLRNADLAFLSFVASFLQFHLSCRTASDRQDSTELLLQDVMTGKLTDEHQIFHRAESLNFFPGSTNYLLLFYSDTGIGFRRTLETVRELQELTPCPTMAFGANIVMLISGSGAMDTVGHVIFPYLEKHPGFKASISAPFSGIPLLRNAYEQCLAAQKLGSVLNPNGTWFDYEAYRELHFTNKYLSDEDVDFFCLPVAQEIVQHDRIHKTRYAYTLMLYIKNFKNAATVARIMNIHRNTMFYRLEKIAEQFQIHYDNPVQMNNLSLSFNILASRYPDIFN